MSDPHVDVYLGPVLGGTLSARAMPYEYRPLGRPADCAGSNPGEIPKTPSELGELLVHAYDLTARRALELNIPVAGSVSGGYDRRVVVWEWMRYKVLTGDAGRECHYGYVIRFCVTINKWEGQGRLSLPFLSAQAQLGSIEASWMMQIRGLVGPALDKQVLPPRELNVETFVIARQSLEAVIKAIDDPTTKFVPGTLIASIDPTTPEIEFWRAAVRAFAVENVRRGRTRSDAQGRLGSTDPVDYDLLAEVYGFFGMANPKDQPGTGARELAERILRGMRVEKEN
ncbi:MAG TPA: hypothetical protein VH764_08530 [Gemmatimonadales bacterium]|jgi:hypothetical protein